MKFTLNGQEVDAQSATADTPLLYVLRNDMQLNGPKFGCGLGECGACAVLIDGKVARSCSVPLSVVEGKKVTTLEGLSPAASQDAKEKALCNAAVRRRLRPASAGGGRERTALRHGAGHDRRQREKTSNICVT